MEKDYCLSKAEEERKASEIKSFLLSLFPVKTPFVVLLSARKTKKCAGSCVCNKKDENFVCRINIYYYWEDVFSLKEIAIHEYAHLIHRGYLRLFEYRCHGAEFWTIYGILLHRSIKMGLLDIDPYTELVRGMVL